MAVVTMTGDQKNPVFHDFLGMSCGESQPKAAAAAAAAAAAWVKGGEKKMEAEAPSAGHGLVPASANSDLGSERQGVNNSEVFHFHGRKNAISGPESSNTFSGRKRSNSDSAYMGLIRDRIFPVGSDSNESSRMMKMFGKEVVSERPVRSHDDEVLFAMQPPPRPTSSLILHPPAGSRPDSILSKWERSLPINPGQVVHYPSRFGHSGAYVEKLSSSYASRDASSGAILISQAAADEGSRTGIKGCGIMNVINATSGAIERNSSGVLPYNNRLKAPQTIEPESSNAPNRYSMTSTTRQMTIFYAGQAHVFDDVHPNKADVIMALAGSSGGSWSTTYSAKSSGRPPGGEAKPCGGENDVRAKNIALSIQGNLVHGVSPVARIPVANDPSNLPSGGNQAGRVDTRLSTPTSELGTEGKRDV